MKKPSYAMGIIVDDIFCPINTDREKEQGVYLEILNPIAKQFEDMLSFHSKVFYMRFDLSVCKLTDDNEAVSKFIQSIKERLITKYKLKRFGYGWVRELDTAKKQHYHVFILLDGHKVQTSYNIIPLLQHYWDYLDKGRVGFVERCYLMIQRNESEALRPRDISHLIYGKM